MFLLTNPTSTPKHRLKKLVEDERDLTELNGKCQPPYVQNVFSTEFDITLTSDIRSHTFIYFSELYC